MSLPDITTEGEEDKQRLEKELAQAGECLQKVTNYNHGPVTMNNYFASENISEAMHQKIFGKAPLDAAVTSEEAPPPLLEPFPTRRDVLAFAPCDLHALAVEIERKGVAVIRGFDEHTLLHVVDSLAALPSMGYQAQHGMLFIPGEQDARVKHLSLHSFLQACLSFARSGARLIAVHVNLPSVAHLVSTLLSEGLATRLLAIREHRVSLLFLVYPSQRELADNLSPAGAQGVDFAWYDIPSLSMMVHYCARDDAANAGLLLEELHQQQRSRLWPKDAYEFLTEVRRFLDIRGRTTRSLEAELARRQREQRTLLSAVNIVASLPALDLPASPTQRVVWLTASWMPGLPQSLFDQIVEIVLGDAVEPPSPASPPVAAVPAESRPAPLPSSDYYRLGKDSLFSTLGLRDFSGVSSSGIEFLDSARRQAIQRTFDGLPLLYEAFSRLVDKGLLYDLEPSESRSVVIQFIAQGIHRYATARSGGWLPVLATDLQARVAAGAAPASLHSILGGVCRCLWQGALGDGVAFDSIVPASRIHVEDFFGHMLRTDGGSMRLVLSMLRYLRQWSTLPDRTVWYWLLRALDEGPSSSRLVALRALQVEAAASPESFCQIIALIEPRLPAKQARWEETHPGAYLRLALPFLTLPLITSYQLRGHGSWRSAAQPASALEQIQQAGPNMGVLQLIATPLAHPLALRSLSAFISQESGNLEESEDLGWLDHVLQCLMESEIQQQAEPGSSWNALTSSISSRLSKAVRSRLLSSWADSRNWNRRVLELARERSMPVRLIRLLQRKMQICRMLRDSFQSYKQPTPHA